MASFNIIEKELKKKKKEKELREYISKRITREFRRYK